MPQDISARFWAKVDKNGPAPAHRPELGQCWVWTCSRFTDGYGRLWRGAAWIRAHRLSWEMANGRPPLPSLCILHECDNPGCVRPEHLYEGTKAQNVRDCIARGRRGPAEVNSHCRGEDGWHAKFTNVEARAIRERYASSGLSQRDLAADIGVSQSTICRIVRGEHYRP